MNGDEPQLGGQDHDNSPMISGRGTKIFVSARGAYQAGNFEVLYQLLSFAQGMQLRLAAVREAFNIAAPLMDADSYEMQRYYDLYEAFTALRQVLEVTTPLNIANLKSILRRFNPDPTMPRYVRDSNAFMLVCAAKYLGEDRLHRKAAINASINAQLALNPRFNPAYAPIVERETLRWYFDMGWALIQERELPLPPRLDHETLNELISDRERMYQEKNLIALIYLMTYDQRRQLMQLAHEAAYQSLESVLATQPDIEGLRPMIAVLRTWVSGVRPTSQEHRLLQFWGRGAFYDNIERLKRSLTYRDYSNEIDNILKVMNYAPVLGYSNAVTRRWHLDVAWAILHDQPIPPLEAL